MATRTDTLRIPKAVIRSKKCREAKFCSPSISFPFTGTHFFDAIDLCQTETNLESNI